jgi:hypothetical protein
MSIIILSQSLKNDGADDIQIDGEFAPSREKLRIFDEFDKNGSAMQFKKCEIKGTQFAKIHNLLSINEVFGFKINCEEKDNLGRNSPIVIHAKLTELIDVISHLKKFIKESGRTVSDDKIKWLRDKIDSILNTQDARFRILVLKNPHGTFAIIAILIIIVIAFLTKGDF